ncbi:serine/threonine-protein kinase [Streptomyces sp. NPDC048629]|uniref:serine/threonine-protein kinase n=1 Tax=Streptomyces sp. NPDC048629 TaxID=3154824 RepID=UPI003421CD89
MIGPYRLTGLLGEGGMGRVYLGRSVSGRQVAVKVVRSEHAADPGFRRRFRREIEAARAVGGFWTAPVVDADPEAASPWVASAYIEAPELGELVRWDGPMGEAALRGLATGLAEALDAIHRTGLVHRDLKPSNVLVTTDGPRVIDFGISKALEGATALTGTGLVVGTPGFMSPEQATGEEVGAPSDVFSLGAVLAFAATGEGPFGAGSVPALLYRVVHDVPRLDGVPEGLRGLVARCLEKDPGRRPTAGELLGLLAEGEAAAPGASASTVVDPQAPMSTPIPVPTPTTPTTPMVTVPGAPGEAARDEGPSAPEHWDAGTALNWGVTWMRPAFGVAGVSMTLGLLGMFSGYMAAAPVGVGGGAVLIIVVGLSTLLRRRGFVRVDARGLAYDFGDRRWHTSWDGINSVSVMGFGEELGRARWMLMVEPRSMRDVPYVLRTQGPSRKVGTFLWYGPAGKHAELARLDAALRRHAPVGTYTRQPPLDALLGR